MKFTPIILSLTIATTNAKTRRRLNTIVGDESDASMSYASVLGGSSKSSKAPTGSPTSAPTAFPTGSPTPEPKPGECGSTIDTGDVINTGGVFTLQKSLRCDCRFPRGPALIVDGQGTVLNLNGYTVECETFTTFSIPTVIKVVGTANTIKGPGTVKGGGPDSTGISLGQSANPRPAGFHTVDSVTIGPDRINIDSNDNTIINNFIAATGNFEGVRGLIIDRNIIKGNTIVNAGREGINLISLPRLGTSDDNEILDNTIISSKTEGISIGGKRNVIRGNTINQSGENGIAVGRFTGLISEGVIIKDNSITNSNEYGIVIGSANNAVVIGNTLAGNTDGPIDNQGTDTVFADNVPNQM